MQDFVTIALAVVLAGILAYALVQWLFKKDTEIENRRRAAAQLAATLKGFGLVHIPEMLISYSVGDYSDLAERIHFWAKLLLAGGEEAVLKEFKQIFDRVMDAKLSNPEGRAYVAARLAEASKPATPSPTVSDLKTPS